MSSERSEIRKISQLNTPHDWVINGKMFRIKSWEIEEEEIRAVIDPLIKHGPYKINVIRGRDGITKGMTLLFVEHPLDVETIRTSLLITETGTELRKTSHFPNSNNVSRTIKTTAPIWITKERMYKIFSKYNTDPDTYDMIVDKKHLKNAKYPIIRFHPKVVDRHGKPTKVNVLYVEFSPKDSCKYDSFIALSMEHRVVIENALSKEVVVLIFDKWTVDKVASRKLVKDVVHDVTV